MLDPINVNGAPKLKRWEKIVFPVIWPFVLIVGGLRAWLGGYR